jgi:Zn-dependent protease with chaperone function
VRLDSANRSFLAIVTIALLLGALVLCGALGGVIAPMLIRYLTLGGPAEYGLLPLTLLPFVALVACSLMLAARSLAQQILATRRLERHVRRLTGTAPDLLREASTAAGLNGRVVLMDCPEPFSFVYGLLRPKVAVSRGQLEAATTQELRAVLEHERYHLSNFDPLKATLLKALSVGFFFLPVLDWLRERYLAARELAADRRAVATCGRRPLAGALLKAVDRPDWCEPKVSAAIGQTGLLDIRVSQLETDAEPRLARLGFKRIALSLLGGITAGSAFLVPILSLSGPAEAYHLSATFFSGGFWCIAPLACPLALIYLLVALHGKTAVH